MDLYIRGVRVVVVLSWLLLLLCSFTSLAADSSETDLETVKFHEVMNDFWSWQLEQLPHLTRDVCPGRDETIYHFEKYTLDAFDARKIRCQLFLSRLYNINTTLLTSEDRISAEVLKFDLESYIDGYEWRMYGALNPISDEYGLNYNHRRRCKIEVEGEIGALLDRLAGITSQLDEKIILMKEAIRLNRTNHNISMVNVVSKIEYILSTPINASAFYHPFLNLTILRVPFRFDAQEQGYQATLKLYVAFARLKEFIKTEYLPNTREHIGVGMFDGGLDYYNAILKHYLSTNVTAAQIHNIGLREVSRMSTGNQKFWDHEFDGIHVSGSASDFSQYLSSMREDLIGHEHLIMLVSTYYDTMHFRIYPKLKKVLLHLPKTNVSVVASSNTFSSYSDGTVYFSRNRFKERPTFTILPVSLHEAYPGHHIQMTYAARDLLPAFRRIRRKPKYYTAPFGFPSYTYYYEGWATYSEFLGIEMKLYDNRSTYELFGFHSLQLVRACLLVVDTGIHAYGWSKNEAVTYLREKSALEHDDIDAIVKNIISLPGRTCAYKMGATYIMEIRKKAEKKLGNSFDVRHFHDQILRLGEVPLHVLRESLDEWIERSNTGLITMDVYMIFLSISLYVIIALLIQTAD